jgi:hypothetical protein
VNRNNQVPEAIENVTLAVLHLMTCLGAFADSAKAEQAKAVAPSPCLPPAVPVAPAGPPPARPGIPGGGERLFVYVGGCAGCARLSRLHRFTVYKIGTTNDPDLDRRLKEIGHEQYGGAIHQGTGIEVEPGFEAWVALAIATSRPPLGPGITILPRAIAVDLPPAMSARSFDSALRTALSKRALHLRPAAGIPKRFTIYVIGAAPRLSEASELYKFSPRDAADGDMLVALIAEILRRPR